MIEQFQNQVRALKLETKRLFLLHREASPATKGEAFKMVAPAEALLHLKNKWKGEDVGKRLFSWNKAHTAKDEATIWWGSGDGLRLCRRWGDRYRELMGLRCCSSSHQAAPHLSPPPDQQHTSALLATHIHLLVAFVLYIHFTLMYLNIVSSICFNAVKYRGKLIWSPFLLLCCTAML